MRLAIILALATALALPAAALGKEVTRVDVCGTGGGCGRITDHDALRAFMQGSEMAEAAPSGPQPSYLLKVYMRHDTPESQQAWTSHWLPTAGVMASEDGPGQFNFTSVGPKLERALRGAARGRTARAARSFAEKVEPVAQVDEVVTPAAATVTRADESSDGGGLPTLAWLGVAAGLLVVGGAGAVGLRRR
jgi:hypothetical protein